ncbi:MAG: SAF domain-containing protein [Candidatus Gastranaerophilales bacterium]|nr:SAF domain-containing protein [Candidatus Gastranaerophilales bacterium]
MSIKKNKNQLIISILVGLAIFAITYQFVIRQHEELVAQKEEIQKLKKGIGVETSQADENTTIYVVAKKDIEKDHTITVDDVEMKDLGMKANGAFTSIQNIIGVTTSKEIKAGRPITSSAVISPKNNKDEPEPGFRAVTATVAANRMAPFIEDGVYLDIYTANNTIQATNIRVIKVLDSGSKSNKLVMFEIKEEDVSPFIYGMTTDKLIPVQRNKTDKSEYSFAYDPFKYSSYTISNEDLDESLEASVSEPVEENYVPVSNRKMTRGQSVEVIRGNVKQTLDF